MQEERASETEKDFSLLFEGLVIDDNPFDIFSRSKEMKDIGLASFDLNMLKEPLSPISHNQPKEDYEQKIKETSIIELEIDEPNKEMILKSEIMQFKVIFDLTFKSIFSKLETLVNGEISKIIMEGFHLEEYLGCFRLVNV